MVRRLQTTGGTQPANGRFAFVSGEKSGGETYTPTILADFVANEVVSAAGGVDDVLRVLDPAVGDGELLLSLLGGLKRVGVVNAEVFGFDTNAAALRRASTRITERYPDVRLHFEAEDFLGFALRYGGDGTGTQGLFQGAVPAAYDLMIANPPYVRTQIMGSSQAQGLARRFGLTGRVDLYYAFLLGMTRLLKPGGIAGIIVSNRFMTTRSGASLRRSIREECRVRHIWDLGDTKIFEAAVLPAVLLVEKKNGRSQSSKTHFTSIYATQARAERQAGNVIDALEKAGVVEVDDGRRFLVQHGYLAPAASPEDVWRLATNAGDAWLETVARYSWGVFRDIGKVRVGVKTCADDVFIRADWRDLPKREQPELLRPVTTHHVGRRFRAEVGAREILYPHEVVDGRRQAVDLQEYPRSARYLERHRTVLESRRYVLEAGRQWFEIWVPQDPNAWRSSKLVFRDIAERPTFWIDESGSVVNGDCYWLQPDSAQKGDLLWLACAVGNSGFIESFYDRRFQNKLYAGRRRFITQYVEEFPLPDPCSAAAREIVVRVKRIYAGVDQNEEARLAAETNALVWQAFGLPEKKVSR